jgi:hypothetical protein
MLAMVHGGERISTPADFREMVRLLGAIAARIGDERIVASIDRLGRNMRQTSPRGAPI